MDLETGSRVVALLGPTAVGKTACSLELARHFPIEIISADSRLFYRGMDIGTAKPSPEERCQVRHHLVDVSGPDDPWSLERFLQAARDAIRAVSSRGALPLVVGGTGQYVTALLEGWQPPPRPPDNSLREHLEAFARREGTDALFRRLEDIDPERAAELDPRNERRVIRALEIYELTGKPPSAFRSKTGSPYNTLRIGLTLPRAELYHRIDRRIDQMLADGWMEEVRRLLEQGPPDRSVFSAIGYSELAACLQNEISFEEAVTRIRRTTRVFVRRQANWFKLDDPSVHWLAAGPAAADQAAALIETWLSGAG